MSAICTTSNVFLDCEQKNVIQAICQKYQVGFCALFGSFCKGTANGESDIDLLIKVFPNWNCEVEHFRYELMILLNRKIDLIVAEDPADVRGFDAITRLV